MPEQLGNVAFVAEAVIWLYVAGVHGRRLKINPNSEPKKRLVAPSDWST